MTVRAEVIGDPIAHSKSPLIHAFWLGKLGIDGEYRACHVRPEELAGHLARKRGDDGWRGCNVTIPHKQTVMALLDRLDPLAERIGAVNTVVRDEDGSLAGYNTDGFGFLEPLLPLLPRAPAKDRGKAIVLGAGGAARAVACALGDEGFGITILNRDLAKARSLANRIGTPPASARALELPLSPDLPASDGARLLVNTTSLGMTGMPALRISLERVSADTIVYDLVYAPLETPLLDEARRRGLRTIDGLAMLIGQAAAAFEKFFGAPAPREHDAELRSLLTA